MARKKEPQRVDLNRERIVKVAKELFLQNGVENTKIADVAKQAGMSKSTLYVYFERKEEILDCISLEAMRYLLEQLKNNIPNTAEKQGSTFHEQYLGVCHTLLEFKNSYPLNFELIIREIKVDDESIKNNPVLQEIYQYGEAINQYIMHVFRNFWKEESVDQMIALIFTQWGSIYGLILLADQKEQYIMKSMHMTKEAFLEQGFEHLYQAANVWKGDLA